MTILSSEGATFPPLSSHTLQSLLTTKQYGRHLYVFDEIPSTNAYALELAESGTHHGTTVLADGQTAGRGRLNRPWYSPKGTNIYCSVLLTHKPPTGKLSWIPLVTGLAIADTVKHHSDLRVSLKWPNDLFYENKKLGGILCESTQHAQNGWAVAVGIGLNVNLEKEALLPDLRDTTTSLAIEGQRIADRHLVIATLLNQLEIWQDFLLTASISQLRAAYRTRCSSVGIQVRVHLLNGNTIEGFAQDITNEGALQVVASTGSPLITNEPNGTLPTIIEIRAGDVVHLR